MFAARRFTATVPRTLGTQSALFHATRPAFVKVGDAIPNVDLVEDSPGNKVNLSKELTGKGVIVGVPAAFSTFTSNFYCNGMAIDKTIE
jgi:2-Cys peroxiredoxin 5